MYYYYLLEDHTKKDFPHKGNIGIIVVYVLKVLKRIIISR